ncbi:DUF6338 family protein [Saccharopolyspora phatthalungensis]|uniref:Uncharacterized protein n=1 Tax=Saccharopolyspora phatthalungensis TaxID=664693 RepID=A0A840QI85_9PSEU|nr:DUF6338 family protein [Saccharopolyspora phatthalungensis]MBB5157063.1 hypothetical protein [Saccharopolyspora phatthalungensis]
MGQAPSTLVQAVLLVLFVLPGVTYQFLRERLRGPVAGERNLGERVLRAVTASVMLDALYAIVAGPALVDLVRGGDPKGWDGVVRQPRLVGLVALVLFIVVPAAAAVAVSAWQRRRLSVRYRPTPTAWDHMFRRRGSCFVRARLKDGTWVGGWYGSRSYATSYPESAELFLESAWRMNPDGSFADRISQTAGLHVRASEIDVIELLNPPEPEAPCPS